MATWIGRPGSHLLSSSTPSDSPQLGLPRFTSAVVSLSWWEVHFMEGGDLPSTDGSSETLATGGDAAAAVAGAEEFGHPREGCEALARAISSTLGGVMRDFDARAEGTAWSQDELILSIDRLTGELDKLLEDAPLPFIMQHATKISSIRKRVSALNLLLKSIQRRIDNVDRMLSTGVPNDNAPPDIVETSSLTL